MGCSAPNILVSLQAWVYLIPSISVFSQVMRCKRHFKVSPEISAAAPRLAFGSSSPALQLEGSGTLRGGRKWNWQLPALCIQTRESSSVRCSPSKTMRLWVLLRSDVWAHETGPGTDFMSFHLRFLPWRGWMLCLNRADCLSPHPLPSVSSVEGGWGIGVASPAPPCRVG